MTDNKLLLNQSHALNISTLVPLYNRQSRFMQLWFMPYLSQLALTLSNLAVDANQLSTCKNYVREWGEECDANDETCRDCKLIDGAQCSRENSLCCDLKNLHIKGEQQFCIPWSHLAEDEYFCANRQRYCQHTEIFPFCPVHMPAPPTVHPIVLKIENLSNNISATLVRIDSAVVRSNIVTGAIFLTCLGLSFAFCYILLFLAFWKERKYEPIPPKKTTP